MKEEFVKIDIPDKIIEMVNDPFFCETHGRTGAYIRFDHPGIGEDYFCSACVHLEMRKIFKPMIPIEAAYDPK